MRQAEGQLPNRLDFLRLHQCMLRLLQAEARFVTLRDVTRDFCEADQLVALPDGIDHDAGPEAPTVLAQAPAFCLVLSVLAGSRQALRRQSCFHVFRQIKPRKVQADDLLRRIPLDPLAARVPAADMAFRIQHVDGVVGDTLDEQRQLPGLVPQPQWRINARCHKLRGPRLTSNNPGFHGIERNFSAIFLHWARVLQVMRLQEACGVIRTPLEHPRRRVSNPRCG